jgi:hypothetical protein
MKRTSRRTAATLAALLLAPLGGCAASNALNPSPVAVNVPADCEAILQHGPMPPPVKPGDDLGAAVAARGANLKTAYSTIDAGRQCAADQRRAYQAAK